MITPRDLFLFQITIQHLSLPSWSMPRIVGKSVVTSRRRGSLHDEKEMRAMDEILNLTFIIRQYVELVSPATSL